MIYNTTEQDSAEGVTEYKEKPTWKQTLDASMKNFTSVSLTTSASNYYYEERDKTVNEWIEADPKNKSLYQSVGSIEKNNIDKLESLYEDGNYEAIKKFGGTQTRRLHIQEDQATQGTAFLAYKKLMQEFGLKDVSDMRDEAEFKAYNDFAESSKVLEESEYTSAKLIGTAGGALQDPITLATLPLGSWKTGATILGTAGRAFLEEAAIETAAQAIITPITYAYKNEIGIRTTLKDEAYNAVVAIGTAGFIRGTGSAVFDLTSNGIKALKIKDPELAEEYTILNKGNVSEDLDSHIDDLYKAEFTEEGITKISNPNAEGIKINNADPIPVESEELINSAKLSVTEPKAKADLMIHSGEDEAGNAIYKSYQELEDEITTDAMWIQKAKECSL